MISLPWFRRPFAGTVALLALLAYLLLEERVPHSREKLASLLWGNSPEARARQSLRQALDHLEASVGPSATLEELAAEVARLEKAYG